MTPSILGVITLALTAAIGIWKFVARVKSERRKLADEAGKKLEDAHKNKSKSDLLDSWDSINRAGRV